MSRLFPPVGSASVVLPDLIRQHARTRGAHPAFIAGDETVSWREFDAAVSRVAHRVLDQAGAPAPRVGLIGGNSVWSYAVHFGALRAGALSAPFSTMLAPATLGALIRDAGVSLLFVGRAFEAVVAAALELVGPVEVIHETALGELFPDLPAEPPTVRVPMEAPYSIIYSSGTTGVPKGIVHSHLARLWFAYEMGVRFGVTGDSVVLIATPPYSNGTNIFLLPAIYRGATSVLMRGFDVETLHAIVSRHRPSHAFMVPTQFKDIVEHPQSAAVDWSSFQTLVTAAAPMPEAVREGVIRLTGPCLAELWGLTEGIGTTISADEMRRRPGSVGRIAPGSDIRLVGPDGREVIEGIGEIVGRSPMIMDGYLNRPEANAEVEWHDPEGRPYLRSGDLGEFDADGYLWIRGRAKDMIISGGFNVYPVDIESVLLRHPAISDAAVFGIPHPRWGEVPVGYYRSAGGPPVDAELLAWANAQLSKPQRLQALVAHDGDFPRNGLGKVLKGELRGRFLAQTPPV